MLLAASSSEWFLSECSPLCDLMLYIPTVLIRCPVERATGDTRGSLGSKIVQSSNSRQERPLEKCHL